MLVTEGRQGYGQAHVEPGGPRARDERGLGVAVRPAGLQRPPPGRHEHGTGQCQDAAPDKKPADDLGGNGHRPDHILGATVSTASWTASTTAIMTAIAIRFFAAALMMSRVMKPFIILPCR